eukprot:1045867-Prorocentrum_minimum.AAC.3
MGSFRTLLFLCAFFNISLRPDSSGLFPTPPCGTPLSMSSFEITLNFDASEVASACILEGVNSFRLMGSKFNALEDVSFEGLERMGSAAFFILVAGVTFIFSFPGAYCANISSSKSPGKSSTSGPTTADLRLCFISKLAV